jgi:hypothetical protein
MKSISLILSTFLSTALLAGCGVYSFSPGGKSNLKSIAVNQFENKTIESGLSSRMTDLVVDAFISDGNIKIASADQADAVLNGTLVSYERKAQNYLSDNNNDMVEQYAVNLVFDVILSDPRQDKELWRETFISEGIYDPSNETEEAGQSRAAEKLVTAIINKTTKSW